MAVEESGRTSPDQSEKLSRNRASDNTQTLILMTFDPLGRQAQRVQPTPPAETGHTSVE